MNFEIHRIPTSFGVILTNAVFIVLPLMDKTNTDYALNGVRAETFMVDTNTLVYRQTSVPCLNQLIMAELH